MWTNEEWHFTHCLFILRLRTANSLLRNRGLSLSVLDPVHMDHCLSRVSASGTARDRAKVNTGVQFTDFNGIEETTGFAGECYMPML
jgi:hypothetical protein